MFAGNYAPDEGWALCNGALLSITDNSQLYSLIGIAYGGDGLNNFALPDLQGRVPISQGQGPNLPNAVIGTKGGSEMAALNESNLPPHTHTLTVANSKATPNAKSPAGSFLATGGNTSFYPGSNPVPTTVPMNANSVGAVPVTDSYQDIVQNSLVINYIIAIKGLYPVFN